MNEGISSLSEKRESYLEAEAENEFEEIQPLITSRPKNVAREVKKNKELRYINDKLKKEKEETELRYSQLQSQIEDMKRRNDNFAIIK